jgi:putative hydrolase of the HAD superfamily
VNEYIARRLGRSLEDAWALRKERIAACGYGTTLEWLRAEEGMDDAETETYFAAIHPEDEADNLAPDPVLRPLLLSLTGKSGEPLPRGILTNSPLEHALRVLDKLEIRDLFDSIFDIRRNGLEGKPSAGTYRRILAELGQKPGSCLLVDDVARYIDGYRAMGGAGVYYDEENKHPDYNGPRIRRLEELRDFLTG